MDIFHFGSISRRHSRLYDEFMLPQRSAILAHLNNDQTIIPPSKMESIKREIVLVPGRWCRNGRYWYNQQLHLLGSLQRYHIMSNRNVVCGSLWPSNRDFVSMFLRSDRSEPLGNCVLLATFNNESRLLQIKACFTESKDNGPSEIQIKDDVLNFDINDLLMLLKRKYIQHPGLGEELWTMESECKQTQRRKVNGMLACGRRTCVAIPYACAAPYTRGECSCTVCSCLILQCLLMWTIFMLPSVLHLLGLDELQPL